jgi:WD40 repeat protein
MIRLLPRTPRGTWLLGGLLWAVGSAALWWALPYRPRAEWTSTQQQWIGYIPDRRAFVTLPFNTERPENGPLFFWDADSGRVTQWFDTKDVIDIDPDVALSPDGALAAIVHFPRDLCKFQVFETATGRVRFDLPFVAEDSLHGLCFSKDSKWFAYSQRRYPEQCVHIWDVDTGTIRRTLRSTDGLLKFRPSLRLAIAPDGRTLATADTTGGPKTKEVTFIQLWDWDATHVIRTFEGPASEGCWRLCFSPDGRHLVAQFDIRGPRGNCRDQVWCWDCTDGRQTLQVEGRIAAVTPGRLWVHAPASAASQPTTQAWDYAGALLEQVELVGDLSPDAKTMATVSIEPHPIRDWVIARGLRWPFSAGEYARTRLVNVATKRVMGELPPWPILAESRVAGWTGFSPEGDLYAESIDFGLRIWDVPPRKSLPWFLVAATAWAVAAAAWARHRTRRLSGAPSLH